MDHSLFEVHIPSALILIADGTEEMEFTITYDTLVRAGINTISAYVSEPGAQLTSTNPPFAKGSRGINIMPDIYFDHLESGPEKYDLLVIPGGAKGAATMSKSLEVQNLVRVYLRENKFVGMICAGSLAALTAGLPKQPLTSHPSVKPQLIDNFEYSEEPVVTSGNLITSRGPGTAFPFAFALVQALCGTAKQKEVYNAMTFPPGTPF